jgi:hypothetical protein
MVGCSEVIDISFMFQIRIANLPSAQIGRDPLPMAAFSSLVVAERQAIHKIRDIYISYRIKAFQHFLGPHGSFSAPRSVPSNREPDRTHGVSGH